MKNDKLVGVLTTLLLACFVLPAFIFAENVTSSTLTEIPEEAIKANNVSEVKKAIENGADVNAPYQSGLFPLMRAVALDSLDVAKLLIDKGVNVNVKVKGNGMTALMGAAMSGRLEMAKLLIEKGADVNAMDDMGVTALSHSAYGDALGKVNKENFLEIAKLLIEKGADVNTKDNGGITALMSAATDNFTDMARLLIEKGADVNAKIDGGITVLMLAAVGGPYAVNGSLDVAKLLIDKGADIDARSESGATALKIAEETGHNEIAALLKQHGAK